MKTHFLSFYFIKGTQVVIFTKKKKTKKVKNIEAHRVKTKVAI